MFRATTAILLLMPIGCDAPGPTEGENVMDTIANLSDAAVDPTSFQLFFVEGSAPVESERRRYRDYFYEVDAPVFTGSSATALVRVISMDGEAVDEKEWTFSKVGSQWKISAAPLP